ncbi:ribbon-helix-helix protein, CopG family [Aquifex sp.]
MKRTTIFLEPSLQEEIKLIAKSKGKKVSEIIREALNEYVAKHRQKRKYPFIGLGKSNRKDISENHEEELWKR